MPHVLSMDREAREYFFSWWNRKVERINRIEDDAQVESREMKHPAQVARLALLMQVLRYAAGELFGYRIGFELLLYNALLTMGGMWLLGRKKRIQS